MPQDFNPRVWWLVLGMNDLGRMQCSEEVVILGILRVIEEIHKQKPDAEIVINSMLPMADLRGGMMPLPIDYQDAFRSKFKGRGAMLSSNANPTLFSRPADAVIASGKPKVTYQRPPTTTKVLSARNKSKFRGSLPPGIMGPPPGTMGPPLGTSAGKTTAVTTTNAKPASSSTVKPVTKESNTGKARLLKKTESDESIDPKEKKKEIKAEKKFIKKLKKDPVNPKLNLDLTKIRVRDPKRLFLARNRLPIWTSINAINEQLRKFAEKQDDKISFFDATDFFAERTEGKKYILRSDRISVRGHPTVEGFQAWEEAVAAKLKKMFDKDDKLFSEEVAAADASVSAAAVLKASDGAAASSEDAKPKDDSDSDD
jgi:predicted DNA-binding WGR domain protein